MRAELLSVGTEILLGQIVDTNAAWLAGRLADLGIDLLWISTVGDNLGRATEAVTRGLDRSDLVVCTGGLGPTEDDLTREAIAAALGETPRVDPALETELRGWFAARGLTMPERNRKQAWLIPSAVTLLNPLGTAPGWLVRRGERTIVAMPGVPREMTRMWQAEVEPRLAGGPALRSRTLKLVGIGESAVEEALHDLVRSTSPTVATYAKADGVHVRLTDRDRDVATRDARVGEMEREIRSRIGRHVWGVDGDTFGTVVGGALAARGWRLATAESVTAGDVARLFADVTDGAVYAGGTLLPGADEDALWASLAPFDAGVRAVAFRTTDGAGVAVRTTSDERRATVRAATGAEARRRGALLAMDVIGRVLLR